MSEHTESARVVADVLAAIVEALDVPMPAVDEADERAHYRLLDNRAADVRIVLAALLRHPGPLDNTADIIRRRTADQPVTYTPFVFERDGGEG